LLARAIMRSHRAAFGVGDEAEFDEVRQIIGNAYTGGSDELKKRFEDAPKYRVEAANEVCRRELDYARGDDFLQIGRCTLAAALQFLRMKLPQGSIFQLAFRAAVLIGFATIVPIVRWLVPSADEFSESTS
jgi:hypothetical protein